MGVIVKTTLLLVLLLGILGALVIYSGVYSVAASEPHWEVTEFLLDTTMAHSVQRHAADIEAPSELDDDSRVRAGRGPYGIHCVTCHGAPGVEPTAIGKGLNPTPPDLGTVASFWSDGELYWIVANGVKMTGMPAFRGELDDEELWSLVAFVRRLPEMTPEDYISMGLLR